MEIVVAVVLRTTEATQIFISLRTMVENMSLIHPWNATYGMYRGTKTVLGVQERPLIEQMA
jgi:hypothetical protein